MERISAPSDKIRITVIGQDYRTPSESVVVAAQTAVDPIVNSGEGDGFAPIGHRVQVIAASETAVNISTTITYDTGYSYDGLSSYIDSAIETYLLELRKTWENTDTIVVRILQIEAAIVSIEGIIDVTGTTVNGSDKNLHLTDGSVPVKGEVSCT